MSKFAEMQEYESVIPAIEEQVNLSFARNAPTKLPDINRKFEERYGGTEVQPSEKEDSIFISLKSSAHKNSNNNQSSKLQSHQKKNVYHFDKMKSRKRNLNYSEA